MKMMFFFRNIWMNFVLQKRNLRKSKGIISTDIKELSINTETKIFFSRFLMRVAFLLKSMARSVIFFSDGISFPELI